MHTHKQDVNMLHLTHKARRHLWRLVYTNSYAFTVNVAVAVKDVCQCADVAYRQPAQLERCGCGDGRILMNPLVPRTEVN